MAGIPWVMPALTTDSGVPVAGAKVFSRIQDTATPTPLYSDPDLTTPTTNPAIADAGGRLRVYRDPSVSIDIYVKTADEATTLIPTTSYPEGIDGSELGTGWADELGRSNDWQTIASASTVDLSAATSNKIIISGTTTITSFGTVASGARFLIRFSGAIQLTYNATSMILPGGRSLVFAAGDYVEAVSSGSGNWRVALYDNPYFQQGSAATPVSVDGAFGYSARVQSIYATPGVGSAPATTTPDETNVHMAAGSNGIGAGHLTRVYTDGTWTDGGEGEAGVIGHAYEVYLTKGGVGFGTSKYITISTTTGSKPRGNETDFERAVNYSSLWGDIFVTTGATDTGVATETISFNGGGSVVAEGVRGVAATGGGQGFSAVDVIYRPSGGINPIRTDGSLYVAGGGSCTRGTNWRYWTFSVAAHDLPMGTQIRAVSGNSFARTQTALNTHDDLFHTVNYDHIGAAVDNAGLGTVSMRSRAVSGGRGEFTWMTGNVNTAPATRMTLQSGLLMVGATGGDKGDGTINATAVYDDNVLLSCFVFDAALDGSVDLAKWDAKVPDRVHEVYETLEIDGEPRSVKTGDRVEVRTHVGALKFSQRLGTEYDPLTLEGYARHWKEKRHLTAFPNEARFQHGDMGTGEWIQRLIETAEIQAVLIDQLHQLILAQQPEPTNGSASDLAHSDDRIQRAAPDRGSVALAGEQEHADEQAGHVDLDAALEAARETHADLFSDTDDISEKQRIEAERDEARESLRVALEENAALKAREPEVRIERVEVERIVERVVEVSSPEAAPLKIIPDEIAAMMDPGDTFSPEVRRKLTERLNVELAELKNLRGLAGEDLKREAEIEKLLGLFARLGEI